MKQFPFEWRMSPRAYTRWCVGVFIAAMAGLAALNIVVDPQLVWGSPWGLKFFPHRTMAWEKTTKAELLRLADPEILFIGSSMVENGIDPESPSLGGRRAFNGGVSWAGPKQSRFFLEYAFRVSHPSEVVIFVEFKNSNDEATLKDYGIAESEAPIAKPPDAAGWTPEDINSPVNPKIDWATFYLSNAIGGNATEQSVSLIANRRRGVLGVLKPNGMRAFEEPTDYRATRALLFRGLGYFVDYKTYGWAMSELDAVAEICRKHSAKLKIVISPIHAQYQECFRAAGRWPECEAWKRGLVELAEKSAGKGSVVELWDASGCVGPLAEPLPSQGEYRKKMKWYVEAFHFNSALGGEVLRAVYSSDGGGSEGVAEAGAPRPVAVRLTSSNIESHLARLREDREIYAREHPALIALVENLLRELRLQSSWRVSVQLDRK